VSFKDPATCKITTSPVLFPHVPAPDPLVLPTRAAAVSIGSRRATVRPSHGSQWQPLCQLALSRAPSPYSLALGWRTPRMAARADRLSRSYATSAQRIDGSPTDYLISSVARSPWSGPYSLITSSNCGCVSVRSSRFTASAKRR
jgi:hypothetical protein